MHLFENLFKIIIALRSLVCCLALLFNKRMTIIGIYLLVQVIFDPLELKRDTLTKYLPSQAVFRGSKGRGRNDFYEKYIA